MATRRTRHADPTQGEAVAGYCACCDAVILDGQEAWRDENGDLYCDLACVAQAYGVYPVEAEAEE